MEQLASIDLVSRTLIEGWVVSKEDVTLKVNGEHICKVTEFYRRQDLVDSGITEEDIAFSIDVSSFFIDKLIRLILKNYVQFYVSLILILIQLKKETKSLF